MSFQKNRRAHWSDLSAQKELQTAKFTRFSALFRVKKSAVLRRLFFGYGIARSRYKAALLIALVSTTPLSARPERSKEKLETLKHSIEKVVAASHANLNIGIEVVSLKTGQILYEKNAKSLFVPASSIKLFTCAAILDRLGPAFRFETQVLKDTKENLYLVGVGDPSLDRHALEDLAMQIALGQEKHFTGDLVVDHSLFDNITNGPGWMWDEGMYYWNAPVDALLIDHSCITLWILPKALKTPPEIVFQAGADYMTIDNQAITCEEPGELKVERTPVSRENKIEVKGALALTTPAQYFQVPVDAPHLYTAHVFQKNLKEHAMTWDGQVRLGKAPADATVVASHRSLPLSVLIHKALKASDNLTANCFFKKLGQLLEGSPGTWQSGSKAVRYFLQDRVQLDTDQLVMLDGSGDSRYNLVSPHQMVQFLRWMSSQFHIAPEMIAALPINGVDGTLKKRLPHITGKVRAKTGTMTGISTISGFIQAEDGEMLAFSIMINGFTEKAKQIEEQIEDPICLLLTQFSHK
ncbi:MAG: D-alanyl-D-alanine carboxypeptidase/D-alanyl-D-alanine-endopeptidase [Simkania sp.]|nr:D-alanyl-D-alanine carboxypeptidase/D-alanyl-D-alanine-endopeptidase [Simkania sp.]